MHNIVADNWTSYSVPCPHGRFSNAFNIEQTLSGISSPQHDEYSFLTPLRAQKPSCSSTSETNTLPRLHNRCSRFHGQSRLGRSTLQLSSFRIFHYTLSVVSLSSFVTFYSLCAFLPFALYPFTSFSLAYNLPNSTILFHFLPSTVVADASFFCTFRRFQLSPVPRPSFVVVSY